jgi:hypothetical protein
MRAVVYVVSLVLLLCAGVARAQDARDDVLRRLTPEQRAQLWRSLTPQQKAELWRRLSPGQRDAMRDGQSPDQRNAIRNRLLEERSAPEVGAPPEAGVSAAPGRGVGSGFGAELGPVPGGLRMGPRRLSPEERQKLREQILESTKDLRDGRADDRPWLRRLERRGKGER